MKGVIRIIKYMSAFLFIFILFNTTKPYLSRYLLERNLESVAIFGTKHSLQETAELLMSNMREKGYRFDEDNFVINKDENHVSINLAYIDEIKIFGQIIKQLHLTAEASAREVKSSY